MKQTYFTFIYIYVCLSFCTFLQAQDLHFTQFTHAPLVFNPSLTGKFEGTFRLGAIYRDQWASVLSNQFVTPSFYADATFKGFSKSDWLGAGIVLTSDRAGTLALNTTHIALSVAYHLPVGESGKTVLSFGAMGDYVQRRFDAQNAKYEDEIRNPSSSSPDRSNINDKINYMDFNGGISLASRLNERINFSVGLGMLHLTQPNTSFFKDKKFQLPLRISLHGNFDLYLTERFSLSPAFIFQQMAGANEMGLQTLFGYSFGQDKDFRFSLGGGYRLRDAAEALIGIDYKKLRVGIAYDFNISDLNVATAGKGGYELAVSYIFAISKKPVSSPTMLCPRF